MPSTLVDDLPALQCAISNEIRKNTNVVHCARKNSFQIENDVRFERALKINVGPILVKFMKMVWKFTLNEKIIKDGKDL